MKLLFPPYFPAGGLHTCEEKAGGGKHNTGAGLPGQRWVPVRSSRGSGCLLLLFPNNGWSKKHPRAALWPQPRGSAAPCARPCPWPRRRTRSCRETAFVTADIAVTCYMLHVTCYSSIAPAVLRQVDACEMFLLRRRAHGCRQDLGETFLIL